MAFLAGAGGYHNFGGKMEKDEIRKMKQSTVSVNKVSTYPTSYYWQ